MPSVLTFDPSGTTKTGYLYFQDYQTYELGEIIAKSAVEQAKNADILIKIKKPNILAWEYSQFFKANYANNDLIQLIYFNGILNWLSYINNIAPTHTYKIVNLEVQRALNNKEIAGLEQKQVQGKTGRPKTCWYFRNKEISIHERDALTVFSLFEL